MDATHTAMRQLELVREAKILDILEGSLNPRLEASGVLAKDGLFYVIFDNLPHIARIGPALARAASDNHMIVQEKGHRRGFEDIAYDPRSGRFYVLIESLRRGRAKFMAAVQEYDADFRYIGSSWLDFPLDRPNKGLEGLTCVHRDGQTYLLGLCEGNRCKGGAEGRIPGGGRIQLFRRGRRNWDRVGKIRLPETVLFEDYSGITVAGDRIAVISQASSALWLGRLPPDGWRVTDAGATYALPRDADGNIVYGTAEGVSWTAPDQVVVVSDKTKPEQDHRFRAKDQSIHVFRIPAPPTPSSLPALSEAFGYQQRIFTEHRQPVVHSLGVGGVQPAGEQPRGVAKRQPAFDLVNLQREGHRPRAARVHGRGDDRRQAAGTVHHAQ
jgi:hypothetical protein